MLKSYFFLSLILTASLALAGCVSQNTTVVSPTQVQAGQQPGGPARIVPVPDPRAIALARAAAPCKLSPADATKYVAAVPVLSATNVIPQQAKDARADGCAGVEFQVSEDGTTRNFRVLRETPPGYGFADALTAMVKNSKFKPSANLDQWYYVSSGYVTSTMTTPR